MSSALWPSLNYNDFKSTKHLLHMSVQLIGKLKLITPFEPHWSNVALWLTSRGLTTGLIPFQQGAFGVELHLNKEHKIVINTIQGEERTIALQTMSVAKLTEQFLEALNALKINIDINLMPQEVENPIAFNLDNKERQYNEDQANAWWRILVSSYHAFKKYHAHFDGETPPVGLMWGTFDLRDARYNGIHVKTDGINAGYIRRNAMNEAQVEVGFWPGNEVYPKPAYFFFIYPEPKGIENLSVKPEGAYWNNSLREFILDYDVLKAKQDPQVALFEFFESCYEKSSALAGWKKTFNASGEPA